MLSVSKWDLLKENITFGRSVIIGLWKIQSYQWVARGKLFLSENSTSMQVLPIALRQHFLS